MKHGNDLLAGGLGAKKQGGEESSTPSAGGSALVGHTIHDEMVVGEDLTGQSASEVQGEADTSQQTAKGSSSESSSSDSSSWTLENALKEVKKTREEAKAYRIKYQELAKQKDEELQAQLAEKESKYQEAMEAAKRLKDMEAKEADKKRTLEERLAHREKSLAEYESRMEAIEKDYKSQIESAQVKIQELMAEREAQLSVYKERLEEMLAKVPDDKREIAELIVRGAGDARDALLALNTAKLKGVFEDKKVVVNHAVPNANSGARVNQAQLDQAEKEKRSGMTSQQLIREGLKKGGKVATTGSSKNSII
jgi:DNA repair exonuclease SbcCD ATPase subunit